MIWVCFGTRLLVCKEWLVLFIPMCIVLGDRKRKTKRGSAGLVGMRCLVVSGQWGFGFGGSRV